MNIIIVLILVIALTGAVTPLLQKILLKNLTQEELMLMMHFAYNCIFILYFIFLYFWHQDRYKTMVHKWKNLKINLRGMMFIIAIIGIITALCYYTLVKKYEISYIIPLIRALSNLLILPFGFFFLHESMTISKIFGVSFIVSGIYLLNRK